MPRPPRGQEDVDRAAQKAHPLFGLMWRSRNTKSAIVGLCSPTVRQTLLFSIVSQIPPAKPVA